MGIINIPTPVTSTSPAANSKFILTKEDTNSILVVTITILLDLVDEKDVLKGW